MGGQFVMFRPSQACPAESLAGVSLGGVRWRFVVLMRS